MTLTSGMTNSGLELLAKSQIGKKIIFTRMKIGNGRLGENTNYAELNDLISIVDNLEIKASEIPIMDVASTGSTISKTKVENVFVKASIMDAVCINVVLTGEPIQESMDDFLESFKL